MGFQQGEKNQAIENNGENSSPEGESSEKRVFFTGGQRRHLCIICDCEFERGPRSPAVTCSEECSRERRLRYGASYRQQGREAKARMLEMFGGRRPTEEEIFQLLQQRKNRK
ncbi:hypothetical protein [Rhizobium rhizogenes]|uniref:hypothetical protein n=1 Tax=Rhizobium rhizogenes TaxID=359 RepID=UPI0005A5E7D0|nr:hypothetical protein [Rhizobium rhizogenes]NTG65386.1 hypothetical protein [Rhizobium rhizogenes]NTI66250.1 hypothetical protein [Rhizobium rhizogenes]TRB11027.1 hypothetical protein EXN67_15645 [Rhizobium rhizogenes]TRB41822.1 hypothetical protein EXN73_16510 [Rhizobium rhizogenes]TRB58692.1 hypothetical protein EXN71_17800 [Rhizobium rhizogenes]